MQQQPLPNTGNGPASDNNASVQKIAENPNPRANENIKHTSFEEKETEEPGTDVGTEITDGEAG